MATAPCRGCCEFQNAFLCRTRWCTLLSSKRWRGPGVLLVVAPGTRSAMIEVRWAVECSGALSACTRIWWLKSSTSRLERLQKSTWHKTGQHTCGRSEITMMICKQNSVYRPSAADRSASFSARMPSRALPLSPATVARRTRSSLPCWTGALTWSRLRKSRHVERSRQTSCWRRFRRCPINGT